MRPQVAKPVRQDLETKSSSVAPAFSVVIPTCNRNDLLARCLERLGPGTQTGIDLMDSSPRGERMTYEVIVSDDGRKGSAEPMIRARFPWVRWVQGPRRGPAANRNCGARLARAPWIVFTDDDCVPEPGWLSAFVSALTQHPDAVVLEGCTTTGDRPPGPLEAAPENLVGRRLWSCNFAIRREVLLDQLAGFDEAFPFPHLEDVDLRWRIERAGMTYPFVPEAVVAHPPRPLPSPPAEARGHESYFYFRAKHGISLAQAGLSLRLFVVGRLRSALKAPSLWIGLRSALRSVWVGLLVLPHVPGWYRKYPVQNHCAEGGARQ